MDHVLIKIVATTIYKYLGKSYTQMFFYYDHYEPEGFYRPFCPYLFSSS